MKKIFLCLAMAALVPFTSFAQDSRGRSVSTIIADNLQTLPADNAKAYNKAMDEIAKTGAEGVEMLVTNLNTIGKERAALEYAINGVASYVSAADKADLKKGVKEGLKAGMLKLENKAYQEFVLSQLELITEAEDVDWIVELFKDEYLSGRAMRVLISTTGSEAKILELVNATEKPCPALAYAVAEKGIAEAEDKMIAWAASDCEYAKRMAYYALSEVGTKKSVPVLAAAAKADKYTWTLTRCEKNSWNTNDGVNTKEEQFPATTTATYAYVNLLNNLVEDGDAATAVKAAKSLLKAAKNNNNVQCAANDIILAVEGKSAMAYVTTALKKGNRPYRVAALRDAGEFADGDVYAAIVKVMPKLSAEAKVDVLNWLGTMHAAEQVGAVISYTTAPEAEVATAAIKAASKIGGDDALQAIIGLLADNKAAYSALLSFNGNIGDGLVAALDNEKVQVNALKLIGTRRVKAASEKVFALLDSKNAEVAQAAKEALAGVVSMKDFDALCAKLEGADKAEVALWQKALRSALNTEAAAAQSSAVVAKMNASKTPERYYSVLAQASNDEAINALMKAYEGANKEAALAALLTINNDKMIANLANIAAKNENNKAVLDRYTKLVSASKGLTNVEKYLLLADGLALAKDDASKNALINALSKTAELPALYLAAQYLDNEGTQKAAAAAVKFIAGKNKAEGGEVITAALNKALALYDVWKASNADAGYAVDEIKKHINEMPKGAPEYKAFAWGTVAPYSIEVATTPKMKKAAKTKALKAAAEAAKGWVIDGEKATFAGTVASSVATEQTYGNFVLYTEYKAEAGASLGVRGLPATITLAATENWNAMVVSVVDERMTVTLNGKEIISNVIIENSLDAAKPTPTEGAFILTSDGKPVALRNTYIKALPATPKFELSAEEKKDGFKVLFDGTSLNEFTGNKTNYVTKDGTIFVTAQYGGSGNLYTKEEYGNFVLRFEFAFVNPGVNNGIGIRTPMGVDAAYEGMEIQVLDHHSPIYAGWLKPQQHHGAVYGIITPKIVTFPELGTWNTEEIYANGDHIRVTVNGEVILDGNIREACQGHNVAPDGSNKNPYTLDHKNHPGLFNEKGHIGLLGHGPGIKFRNIRIKELK
ncbi:MAG: DUF1080 domain-containing protein [Rikenellaceae bacterium]|nr:DUF1080 domain-containing protein [Rikenellaceae bacterium]